jgi:hypothetical protein
LGTATEKKVSMSQKKLSPFQRIFDAQRLGRVIAPATFPANHSAKKMPAAFHREPGNFCLHMSLFYKRKTPIFQGVEAPKHWRVSRA